MGWSTKDNTWEPIEHLAGCEDMIAEFKEREKTRIHQLEVVAQAKRKEAEERAAAAEGAKAAKLAEAAEKQAKQAAEKAAFEAKIAALEKDRDELKSKASDLERSETVSYTHLTLPTKA